LYYHFLKRIQTEYNNAKQNSSNNIIKDKYDTYIKKLTDLKKNPDTPENKEKIININKIIANIGICEEDFIRFIDKLSSFIFYIYKNFLIRFENSVIFSSETFNENQRKDIILFSDFFNFLVNFDFLDDKNLNFYTAIWNDTFNHVSFENVNYKPDELISYAKNGENLKVNILSEHSEIKNIDNYHIYPLLSAMRVSLKTFEDFELDKFLRMDKYDSHLYLRNHWEDLCKYVVNIFSSNTIKSLIESLYPEDKIFLEQNLITNILNNLRFFNFDTDFVGQTKKRFLSVYIISHPLNNLSNKHRKIVYLALFLIVCFHEIIGHLFLRIHNYLKKEKVINSPMPNFPSVYAKRRGKKMGEKVEELLFGNYGGKMNLKQMLFILDINNYSYDYKTFCSNFKAKSDSVNFNDISDELKKFMNLYDIKINNREIKSPNLYNVGKYINNDGMIEFPPHHSMKKLKNTDIKY